MRIERDNKPPRILKENIHIRSEETPSDSEQESAVVRLVSEFGPREHSKALVFVTSRAKSEDLASLLGAEGFPSSAFHAGLPRSVRNAAYDDFLSGRSLVLCATKAFGLGMDIPDIHLVIHFGPPSSLEDFVQEIGRAGRDTDSLKKERDGRAESVLLYSSEDFGKMRDRIKNASLSNIELQHLHELLVEEMRGREYGVGQEFPVETARLARRLRPQKPQAVLVRTGLHWLERMKRVRVGDFAPPGLEVTIKRLPSSFPKTGEPNNITRALLYYLFNGIDEEIARTSEFERWMVPLDLPAAQKALGFPSQDHLLASLANLVKNGWISLDRRIDISLTENRRRELQWFLDNNMTPSDSPLLAALVDLFSEIQKLAKESVENSISLSAFRQRMDARLEDKNNQALSQKRFGWVHPPESWEAEAVRVRKTTRRKANALLKLLSAFGILTVENDPKTGTVLRMASGGHGLVGFENLIKQFFSELVQCGLSPNGGNDAQPQDMSRTFGFTLGWLLSKFTEHSQRRSNEHLDIYELEALLWFFEAIGYLTSSERLLPVTLNVEILEKRRIDLAPESLDKSELDKLAEYKKMKLLRLGALEAVATLTKPGVMSPEDLRGFIENEYFQAGSSTEIIKSIAGYVPKNDATLQLIQGQALEDELDSLTDEQRAIYDARVDLHTIVLAGPGSGKTHTLLLRLVRLIHEEDTPPDQILVLAFTRAVVSELENRLRHLTRRLGYAHLGDRVRVRTFHSFAIKTLREWGEIPEGSKLQDEKDWFARFCKAANDDPRREEALRQQYRYVFVDEFQDVLGSRFKLLEILRGPKENGTTKFFVVGDDDQSIYDYEETEESPGFESGTRIFERFKEEFQPYGEFALGLNHRSAQAIVDECNALLPLLPGRQKQHVILTSARPDADAGFFERTNWCENGHVALEQPGNLTAKVSDALSKLGHLQGKGELRSSVRVVAVLARTNLDVYLIRRELTEANLRDGDSEVKPLVMVQGQETNFEDRRDVAFCLDSLASIGTLSASRNLKEYLSRTLLELERDKAHWLGQRDSRSHELTYLAEEFLELSGSGADLSDYCNYVRDISRDGNYLRVVLGRIGKGKSQPPVVLSTIHKVKGVEFPAVLLPSSPTSISWARQANPKAVENERQAEIRVLYVGMTRAEDILMVEDSRQLQSLLDKRPWTPESRGSLGTLFEPLLKNVFFGYYGQCNQRAKFIEEKLAEGMAVSLVWKGGKLKLVARGQEFGQVSGPYIAKHKLNGKKLQGTLEITGIYRRHVWKDETPKGNDGKTWKDDLTPEVQERGYYYVVEVGGLVSTVS